MNNFIKGIITLFKSAPGGSDYAFYTDVSGRLYYAKAPPGTSLSNSPYATFMILNDVDLDTFTENMVTVYLQFSLFSGSDGVVEIGGIDSDLTTMLKDKTWAMTGATIVHCHRTQGDGPISVPANTEAGTEEYWIKTIDYEVLINRD